MELEQVFKLIDAGFTKKDILELTETKTPEEPAQTTASDTEKEPEKGQNDPADLPGKSEDTEKLRELQNNVNTLQASLDKLTNAIISKNLNQTTAETMQEQTISDILAKVIAPPRKDK